MIAVKPIVITESILTSSIAEPDASVGEVEWDIARNNILTSYDIRANCFDGQHFYCVCSDGFVREFTSDFIPTGVLFAGSGLIAAKGQYLYKLGTTGTIPNINVSIVQMNKDGSLTGLVIDTGTDYEFAFSNALFCDENINYGSGFKSEIKRYTEAGVGLDSRYITGFAQFSNPVGDIVFTGLNYYISDNFQRNYGDGGLGGDVLELDLNMKYTGRNFGVNKRWFSFSGDRFLFADVGDNYIYPFDLDFVSSGAYQTGELTTLLSTHSVYQAASKTVDSPDVGVLKDVPTWIKIKPTNKFAMFDSLTSTRTIADSTIIQTITPTGLTTAIAGFSMSGVGAINITITIPVVGEIYNKDVDMVDNSAVIDAWTYFLSPIVNRDRFVLLDIPPFLNQTIVVTFTGGIGMKVGELVLGPQIYIGVANHGTSIQLLDFSTQERGTFGEFNVVKRGKADLVKFEVSVNKNNVGYVRNQLAALAQTPTVWIGADGATDDATQVMGYYESFTNDISTPTITNATITVQGLVYDTE